MDEEQKKAAEAAAAAAKGEDTPKEAEIDAFGNNNKAPVPPAKENKGGEGGKKYDPIPEDHPTISALKKQIDEVKSSYGGNLVAQRDVIKRLEAEIETLKKGKDEKKEEGKDGEDLLFKDIKWSKDLTQEERDEMTETEIKQMDEIAAMKDAQNKLYSKQQEKAKNEEKKEVDDLNNAVRDTAKELAKGEDGKDNVELANQIIEASKMFNLVGLSVDEVKERVKMAAQHVPNYKPPKEQIKKDGKAVRTGGTVEDPFGVDRIIEEATSGGDGNYTL